MKIGRRARLPLVIGATAFAALLAACTPAATVPEPSMSSSSDASQAPAAALPAACAELDLREGSVIAGAELAACVTEVIRERNTYRVVGSGADITVTSDVRLDPLALHVESSDGDVYEVRGDDIHQTAGEDAPRSSTIGYDGDDWEKLMLAQVLALVQSQQTAAWTEQLIAAGEWRVTDDGDAIDLEATGPIALGEMTLTGQRLRLAPDATLISAEGTSEFAGLGGFSSQTFSDWGEPIEFPPVG